MISELVQIGLINIKTFENTEISWKNQILFAILNLIQIANVFFICAKDSDTPIVISSMIWIVVSIVSNILIFIMGSVREIPILNITIFFLLLQIVIMLLNKYYIVNYDQIKEIYIYAAYSYEFIGMLILYIIMENIFNEPIVTITMVYIFILLSIFAIQRHDQNNQSEQYFIILSFIMLFPTLVFIVAPSIYFCERLVVSDMNVILQQINQNYQQIIQMIS